ncbi:MULTISPECIES: hypothetical protein [unclassified Streptomyces]|uniref:hypothetical protein n=1 Tax=unclassified Streptomyces TaxID=2593676 RepID=UPI002251E394|nr:MULTISPECIES: hypothetical protein [unclassified Streptomyces]WSP54290.1 hypothetical protein OG306_07775 [Streptomyces sp. NBC_01241]WSU25035.1 hypothetical protein OG508_31560 [Streptomyces sp. NBC_01108]MCX4785808.1 hypothetical protein [Streptomyces sp. NBC_01221]MCX4798333.1 hypothetical protein [Streptomyces sp. NBC_01242]WSJ39570.1 hypothetical protein OG772_28565 [Streptomyces sp. NBC_01321]
MSDSMPVPGTAPGAAPAEGTEDPSARTPDGADAAPPHAAAPSPEPAASAPLGIGRTPTGNAEVDARLERLADADHLPADGHIEVYEDVHRGLRDALTALDARPAPAPVPAPMPSYDNRS